jgi:quercetin dioxygenase-like cupin family protein
MSSFDDLARMAPQSLFAGVVARVLHGERITFAVVELDPEATVPEHSHANEQLGMVLRGSMRLRIGEDERTLGPGETYSIASGTPHEAHGGPDGAEVIDVFSPPREDWAAAERLGPQPPRWP